MAYTLKNGTETQDRRLDRIPMFDQRSLSYRINASLNAEQREPVSKRWAAPAGTPVLDQGREGACFTGDVLIKLANGALRPIKDIRLLDEVVTAEGRVGRVIQLMVREANRGMVEVAIEGHVPLRCTPEHPVLTTNGYVAAEQLKPGDRLAVVKYQPQRDEPLLPRDLVDISDMRGVVAGEMNAGGVTVTINALPELLTRTPALGRLLGLYAAEGHTTANKVTWSYGGHERGTLVPETVDLIKTVFDAQARVQVRPNGAINVVLYGKTWRRLFETLIPGTSKHGDKRLSEHVAQGPDEYRRALLEGWIAGDGHTRRTEVTAVSVSRTLSLDMHSIATSLDLRPRLRSSAPSMNQYAASRQQRYDFAYGTGGGSARSARQDDAAVWRRVQSVVPVEYEGYVYNLEVEGDHSYVADGIGVHNCVGFGITHELLYYPVAVRGLDANFAKEKIYWVAQREDPWPGGSYPGASPIYEGTSVLYGIKAAADLGYYQEYRWATSEMEMRLGVGYLGPAIIGVDWYEGMFRPAADGYIRPTGDKAGGHCTLIIGVNVREKCYILHNSWGPGWGENGNAKISFFDMEKLLGDGGECCIITQRTLPPPVKHQAATRAAAILPDTDDK